MTLTHLDEAYIQLAMNDNPDLPKEFIREVVTARQEPITEYQFDWIRKEYEARHDEED